MSLSILVPTYKRPALLKENLASIIRSNVKADEVIVGDDGGDEETRSICEAYQSQLPIRYLQPEGKGALATNITRLLKVAKSEWILLLHDDDYLTGDHAAYPMQFNKECDFFFTDHWIAEENGTINQNKTASNSKTYGRTALKEGLQAQNLEIALYQKVCLDGFYVRRNKIEGIYPEARFGHVADFVWVFQLLNTGLKVCYSSNRSFAYRLSSNGLTGSGGHINEDTVIGLKAIRPMIAKPELQALVTSMISMHTWYAVNAAVRREDGHTAWSLLRDISFHYTHSVKHKIMVGVQIMWILLKAKGGGRSSA